MRIQHTIIALLLVSSVIINCSCRKLIEIPPPYDSITTLQTFSSNKEAEMAMAGVYSYLANGVKQSYYYGLQTFSSGFVTILAGLSSGEIYNYTGTASPDYYPFSTNKLTYQNSYNSSLNWESAYIIIYGANSIIEGIEASTSAALIDSVRKELTGEAKFIRAFSYFYLVNLYGDVPLVLTIDFNKTATLPRAPHADVYTQMIKDLKDAIELLPADYSVGAGERIRVNKWTAMALLARVYLYTGDHTNAAALSTAIINQLSLFKLENDLNNVFLTGSRESIWQLGTATTGRINATLEGDKMIPGLINTGTPEYALSAGLRNAFEPGDQRWVKWTNSTDNSASAGSPQPLAWYPYKYKMYVGNAVYNGPAVERVAPFRLAEQYLIRAEAIVNGAPGTLNDAIDDINAIRNRAGLLSLPYTLTNTQVTAAIAQERQIEFFAEFGHRWFDLKRTGRAHDVLITNPLKLPWDGDHQLLYPIPKSEILRNHFLIQTPGY